MRQTQLFTKTRKEAPKDEVSLNAQLLVRAGFVDKLIAGVYSYLPLGLRVLGKIEHIIREEMNRVDGQEILMPALHPKENWDKTGRWDTVDILFKLTGSGEKEYALGASHEEVVTPLIKKSIASYKDLPLSVYQIQTKFRNEARAKSGLLRGREFRMKDMYSFHADQKDLDAYYDRVAAAYMRVYARCGLGDTTYKTYASGGIFSSDYSHEFQTVTPFGEDIIYLCTACKIAINKEIIAEQKTCPTCGGGQLSEQKAIEVGNIFKLGTKFSEAFDVSFTTLDGQKQLAIMGCYGIGPSRMMGAIVEVLSDDKGIVWPREVAPFQIHLISLAKIPEHMAAVDAIYEQLLKKNIDVLYDDRPDVRPGEKFIDSDLMGIPTQVIVSEKTLAQQSVEVKERTSTTATLMTISSFIESLNHVVTRSSG